MSEQEPEQYGAGQVILHGKCDIGWTDKNCPNPATCARYHYGQFGHKVLELFCDECWSKPEPVASLRWLTKGNYSESPDGEPNTSIARVLDEEEFFERYTPEEAERLNNQWMGMIGKKNED